MNIFVGGNRSFLIGEYSRARKHHRPSSQTWQRLRDSTTAEILADEAAEQIGQAAFEANEAEALAQLRHERLKAAILVIAVTLAAIGAALPFAIPIVE